MIESLILLAISGLIIGLLCTVCYKVGYNQGFKQGVRLTLIESILSVRKRNMDESKTT